MQVKQYYVERLAELRRKWASAGKPSLSTTAGAAAEDEVATALSVSLSLSVQGSARFLERLRSLASSVMGFRWLAFPLTKSDKEDGTENPYLIFHRLAVKVGRAPSRFPPRFPSSTPLA